MATAPITYINLGVGGMTCDDCVDHVTGALKSVPGVQRAEVSLANRSAVVEAAPGVATSALTDAIHRTGYSAFERRRHEG